MSYRPPFWCRAAEVKPSAFAWEQSAFGMLPCLFVMPLSEYSMVHRLRGKAPGQREIPSPPAPLPLRPGGGEGRGAGTCQVRGCIVSQPVKHGVRLDAEPRGRASVPRSEA